MLRGLAVVCHDAGSAEIISSWLRQHPQPNVYLVLEGPAISIFEGKSIPGTRALLASAVDACTWMLCGTSWQSELERDAIALAKTKGKRVVVFLDHWVNYRDRFLQLGQLVLPDELWVGDEDAFVSARQCFADLPITLKGNAYFEEIAIEFANLSPVKSSNHDVVVLYVCEPVSEHCEKKYGDPRYLGYTEQEALKFFLNSLGSLVDGVQKIIIRPHPSEKDGKYDWVKSETQHPIEISKRGALLPEMAGVHMVAGCESMAMVIGVLTGRRVVSTIPTGGQKCRLPHKSIEHLGLIVQVINHA
jgi:hypothetical protein